MPFSSGSSLLLDAEYLLGHLGVAAGMTVADLGCGGKGHFVFPAAKLVGQNGKVYAVDIMRSALSAIESEARAQSLANTTTIWADLEKGSQTGLTRGTVDRATLINVLFQTSHPETLLEEARRMLKPSGRLLVVDWLPESADPGPAHRFGPSGARRLGAGGVQALAAPLGFRVHTAFLAGQHHYGLVFVV